MASRITCTWVIWLFVLSTSALLQGATARDRDETSKQGGTASKKRNAKIAGCVAYDAAGKCNNCTSPRYTLTADGACDCSPGYERSSANSTCKRGGACLNKCGATYLDDGKGGKCSCDYWWASALCELQQVQLSAKLQLSLSSHALCSKQS